MIRLVAALFILPSLLACATTGGTVEHSQLQPTSSMVAADVPMLRLGVISDAQLTTTNAPGQIERWRSALEDKLVNVALRPPAADMAEPHMMRAALDSLRNVDFVVYTGDAANSGCRDEIDGAFRVLREYRARSGTPVMFAIGNHDYLGAGNTSEREQRVALCGPGNPPLTKLDVIRIAHEFNVESAAMLAPRGWTFVDNVSDATTRACEQGHIGTRVHEQDQHMKPGCFYAGVLALGDSIHFLILDTSDYADVKVPPTAGSSWTSREFAGLRGAISFDAPDSQGDWLNARTAARPRLRILASHYNLSGTRWRLGIFGSQQVGWPSDYLDPVPELGNRWIYGHTHIRQPAVDHYEKPLSFCAGSTCAYLHEEINVGSTTDWMPHALIATIGSRRSRITPIWLTQGCDGVKSAIRAEAGNPSGTYASVNGRRDGVVLFGIDRSYRRYKKASSADDRRAAYQNVAKLVERLVAANQGLTATAAWTCVGALAAEYEQTGGTLGR